MQVAFPSAPPRNRTIIEVKSDTSSILSGDLKSFQQPFVEKTTETKVSQFGTVSPAVFAPPQQQLKPYSNTQPVFSASNLPTVYSAPEYSPAPLQPLHYVMFPTTVGSFPPAPHSLVAAVTTAYGQIKQTVEKPASRPHYAAVSASPNVLSTSPSSGSNNSTPSYSSFSRSPMLKEFRGKVSDVIVRQLSKYMKEQRIASKEDFKHLARKLTHVCCEKEEKYMENGTPNGSNGLPTFNQDVKKKVKKLVDSFFDKLDKPYSHSKPSK
jgi:histone-lysine N-methyltransferase SETD2